jgi:hypothetical protein
MLSTVEDGFSSTSPRSREQQPLRKSPVSESLTGNWKSILLFFLAN